MLQIPRVPTVKTGFYFEGVAEHQLKQQLAAEIRETIKALIESTYVPGWQEMLYKFINCIESGQVRDLARLPYPTNGPNSTAATPIGCVYARLSWTIQLFWSQCLDGTDNTAQIRTYLFSLRQIAMVGIDKCKMLGNPREGYWLARVVKE